MTLEELAAIIRGAAWFSRVGQFRERENAVPLDAVASSADWVWLPTSRDQTAPLHDAALIESAERGGKAAARRQAEMSIAKEVLASLRSVPDAHPTLIDGPHDLTLAAKGGAQYATRMAAREIVAGQPGFWCDVVREYAQGFSPCGLSNDGRLVVY